MNTASLPESIRNLYASPCIRGRRITRMGEQSLGQIQLDASTAWELGKNNVGVFVGGCWSFDDAIRRLTRLDAQEVRPCWVIVTASNQGATFVMQNWFHRGDASNVSDTRLNLPMRHNNVILATPETLRSIDRSAPDEVAGVILIDDDCIVYLARGGQPGQFSRNDRPQHVANFRNQLMQDGWAPPLFLLTIKPSKSVSTDSVARAFCLDAFWFVDGGSLSCGTLIPPRGGATAPETNGSIAENSVLP